MLAVEILILEFKVFGVNSLIELSIFVIVEYSGFRGANSLQNLLEEFGLFEARFVSGFRAAKSTSFSALNKKRFAPRLITSNFATINCSSYVDILTVFVAGRERYNPLIPFLSLGDDQLKNQMVVIDLPNVSLDDYKIC